MVEDSRVPPMGMGRCADTGMRIYNLPVSALSRVYGFFPLVNVNRVNPPHHKSIYIPPTDITDLHTLAQTILIILPAQSYPYLSQ